MFKKFQKWFEAENVKNETKPPTDDSLDGAKPKETSTPLQNMQSTVVTRVLPSLVPTTTRQTQTPQRSKAHVRCEFRQTHVFKSFESYRQFIKNSQPDRQVQELDDLVSFCQEFMDAVLPNRKMATDQSTAEFGKNLMGVVRSIIKLVTLPDDERIDIRDADFLDNIVDFSDLFDRTLRDIAVLVTRDAIDRDPIDYEDNYFAACSAFLSVYNS